MLWSVLPLGCVADSDCMCESVWLTGVDRSISVLLSSTRGASPDITWARVRFQAGVDECRQRKGECVEYEEGTGELGWFCSATVVCAVWWAFTKTSLLHQTSGCDLFPRACTTWRAAFPSFTPSHSSLLWRARPPHAAACFASCWISGYGWRGEGEWPKWLTCPAQARTSFTCERGCGACLPSLCMTPWHMSGT